MNKSIINIFALSGLLALTMVGCKTTEPAPTSSGLQLELVARHVSGQYGESAAEIVGHDKSTQTLYVINGADKAIDMIDIYQLPSKALPLPYSGQNLSSQGFKLPQTVKTQQGLVQLGGPTSLSIHSQMMAVAVTNKNKQANGAVLFYSLGQDTPQLIKAVSVGALPDMVTFNHDASKVIIANEGEPSKDYRHDPEGSISIITTAPTIAASAIHLDFNAYNNQRQSLEATGVKFASPDGTTVAQDLEPEYITVSPDNTTAYVSLQENNALAIIDLNNPAIKAIKGLGYKDWSQYKIDVSNKDGINLAHYENLYGLYQPDSLASYQVNGETFVLSANEGDARDYIYAASQQDCEAAGHQFDDEDGCISYSEEVRAKKLNFKSPSVIDSYYDKKVIGRLKVTKVLGDDDGDGMHEKLYSYGARSFSIWDQSGNLVFDSGDEFTKILVERYGEDFNSNESKNKGDNRSDDKGSEPEAITIGRVGSKTYAFIGLERHGGIMIYDVSNPRQPRFENYINNRDFTKEFNIDDDEDPVALKGAYDQVGDLAPEGLAFIAAQDSPTGKPLLAVANEVSGSVSVYQIK